MSKKRADLLLVEQGLAPTASKAGALILAGEVFVGDRRVDKAGEPVGVGELLSVRGQSHPYVSRGGVKLAGALDTFGLDVRGFSVADFGASTGGFTDCLLQRGADKVYAIDVGYGQLAHSLRIDPRVAVMERTNARHLKSEDLDDKVELVVIDVSFIGLEKLLPATKRLLRVGGDVVALVKPQFQVGKEHVEKGGVVRDDNARKRAVEQIVLRADELSFTIQDQANAAIHGPKGNREIFVWLKLQVPA